MGAKETIDGENYEGWVFKDSGVESVIIPSTLKRLEISTFWKCNSLASIVIPNGVEQIGNNCFWCSGVEQITLPNTLRKIDEDAFICCIRLKTVWVEKDFPFDIGKYVGRRVEVQKK